MALTDRERKALALIQQTLERDDPELAQRFRRLGTRRAGIGLAYVGFVLAVICLGLGLVAVGADLGIPVCSAVGLAIATCGPIGASLWFGRRDGHLWGRR